ncbi:hypothetical protein DW094_14740 [Ruminococcaceae bacterium AM07-15]|nr:hypothetical protein DW094_14740 [Ruminococcaceae bacterium AM07-15]
MQSWPSESKRLPVGEPFLFGFVLLLSAAAQYGCGATPPRRGAFFVWPGCVIGCGSTACLRRHSAAVWKRRHAAAAAKIFMGEGDFPKKIEKGGK